MRALLILGTLLLLMAGPALRSEAAAAEPERQVEPAADPDGKALAQATKAVAELRRILMSHVQQALRQGGPPAAIDVCRKQAAGLAAGVAKRHRLRIGRTSARLRNPANTGPAWMAPILEKQASLSGHQAVELPEAWGFAFPITTASACTRCHGDEKKIGPELRKRLRALYPKDAATGFKKGDLRGWFWVEVPRTK